MTVSFLPITIVALPPVLLTNLITRITGTATYLVQPDDTCTSIANLYNNFTLSIFYYWNP